MDVSAPDIAAALIAFALGSIPTAFLAAKLMSRGDIRKLGSGNPGALNATVQMGIPAGLAVLAVDAGKGVLAIIVAQRLGAAETWVYLSAVAVTLGHNFTPFLRFAGGKGAATVLGISAFMLWQITAVSAAAGIGVLAITRHGVLAVACVFFLLNALTIATGQTLEQILLCLALTILVAGTHVGRRREDLAAAFRARDWRRVWEIH